MKKIDLGQAVQIVANLGVIASIVFLGIEMRQNNFALNVQARLERENVYRQSNERVIGNPELVRVIVKAGQGEELSVEEDYLLLRHNLAVLLNWNYVFMQVHDGLLPESTIPLANWRGTFHEWNPRMTETWVQSKDTYPAEFRQFMQEQVVDYCCVRAFWPLSESR